MNEPRILITPESSYTDGKSAGKLARAYGLKPDPWQQDILNIWLGRDKSDNLVCRNCGLSIPRQNGKNALLEMLELYYLCTTDVKILHTAHEVRTSREAFTRLAEFFTKYSDLKKICKKIRYANGQEAIYCEWGEHRSQIQFTARTRGANRGRSANVLICDESQELTNEQMQALLPVLAASDTDKRQVVMVGTPPPPEGVGDVFKQVRASALAKNTDKKGLCWIEYSVAELTQPNNREAWYKTNPAMGYRISEDFTLQEAQTLSVEGFNRERLGYWEEKSENLKQPITKIRWDKLATETPPTEIGTLTYGIKFDVMGKFGAIAVANKVNDITHLEVLEYRSCQNGLRWIYEYLDNNLKKIDNILIDGNVNTETLLRHLEQQDGYSEKKIWICKMAELGQACQQLANAVKEKKITHYNQEILNASVVKCVKRPIGKLGLWGFANFEDGAGIVAESVALAYYSSQKVKKVKTRGRIW